MKDKLQELEAQYNNLEQQMSDPAVLSDVQKLQELNREHAHLSPIIKKYRYYLEKLQEQEDSTALLAEEKDGEMREMMQEELRSLEEEIATLEDELLVSLLPRDPRSGKDIIMEIRAGTGGDEAALFAADLFRMYSRYTDVQGWRFETLEVNETEIGGFKEIIFAVKSDEAYDNLKYESGVHRVQRVPSTESGGRVHTSAVTVAVMTEPEAHEIDIAESEIRVDVYRASGHGGQSVNTTDSAVRLTHIPTGLIVTCQDEKSQHKNKAKALRVLRARLSEKYQREQMEKEARERKAQVGSGDRSERIRTYNFPQSRITDHRIGLTLYSLERFIDGDIQEVVDALRAHEVEELIKVTQGS